MSRVPFEDLFRAFFGALENSRIAYFAYGGVAVGVWGNPRETQDVDAVVVIDEEHCERVIDALTTVGFACSEDERRAFPIDGWIRLGLEGRHADIAIGKTSFDESALSRRVRLTVFKTPIWMASPEDLLLYKITAYRRKDLADAEAIFIRNRGKLDLGYLRHWAAEIAAHSGKFEVPSKLEELMLETGNI